MAINSFYKNRAATNSSRQVKNGLFCASEMAGIYIHIPFCRQACRYCNFYFTTAGKYEEAFIEALLLEIAIRADELSKQPIHTIYFGGGTPSHIRPAAIQRILKDIGERFQVAANAEITLEANPDDIHSEALKAWKEAGINRFSLGIQSFFDEDLAYMHRAHGSTQARKSLELIAAAGFNNLSADLIFGYPLLSNQKLEKNLDYLIQAGVPHISCYALTVEEGTNLYQRIKKKKEQLPGDEQMAGQYLLIDERLGQAGYEHYEISNYALPGKRSVHNSNYWNQMPYIGFGPAAHSYDGKFRAWNVSHLKKYIDGLSERKPILEREELSEADQMNEYIMISLRTKEGLNFEQMRAQYEPKRLESLLKKLRELPAEWISEHQGIWVLSRKGQLHADGIASGLFVDSF